jgi:hypothetical protein
VTADREQWQPQGTLTNKAFGAAAGEASQAERRRVVTWVAEHVVPTVTIVGLVFYAAGLIAFAQFYESFGVEPREVGVDYVTTLGRVWEAVVFWFAPAFVLTFFAWGFLAWVLLPFLSGAYRRASRLWKWREEGADVAAAKQRTTEESAPTDMRGLISTLHPHVRGLFTTLYVVIPILIVLFIAGIFRRTANVVEHVKHGDEVAPPAVVSDLSFFKGFQNPLRLRAARVHVAPSTAGGRLPSNIRQRQSYGYLGRSSDTIILYDSRRQRTLRIPAALIIVADADK